ncbi:PAS domain-containing protein, partial [Spirulina sp. 06S082]|uniref:PAS domain-containing protein n=1 Tax=Spirulina sp. 06S082 TaxID=3110248 RepID=UPI002B20A1B8
MVILRILSTFDHLPLSLHIIRLEGRDMAKQAQSVNTSADALEFASGTGVYEWHAGEDRLVWSPGLQRIYGLPKTPVSEGGFIRHVHPDDRIRVEAETAGFLGTRADTYSHEFRIVRPDGSVRFILDRGMIERDDQGRALIIRGLNIDLTDCRRPGAIDTGASAGEAKPRLARAEIEGRLATALRAGKLGVHEFDPRSGALVWDATIREIWGITPDEEVTYETFLAGIHPDDRATMQAAVDAALDSNGPGRYDAIYRVVHRQSRQVRWVRADGDISFDGPIAVKLVGTVKDITERKNAETRLRESEERFRNMADNAPVMIWVTEADGTCTYLNRCWFEFTGQTSSEALGFGWLKAVHPDAAAQSERIFREATERRQAFRLDYRLRGADGNYHWAVDSARPRLGADGEFLGFIGSVLD